MTRRAVITGIGAMSPNGMGREAFWTACRAGRSGVRRLSALEEQRVPVTFAGYIEGFDPGQFMDERDLPHVSRTVPLALSASAEALRDAGVETERLSIEERRRIGVLLGSGGGALEFVERQFSTYFAGHEKRCSVYTIPSSTSGTLASEISMRFGLRGFSHLVSTGCTSSTDAINYARLQIQQGGVDMVLCGGADAPVAPLILRGFCLMKILSLRNHDPERASRPFSADRDGFVLGEGAWMFVLEEYEHARARGARIYGEIAGYGSTCEAFHRVRLEESGEEPARAMGMALADAALPSSAIGYINLHGTSTVLNDRIETRAVKLAFGAGAERLPMSALKSMIGHPQGASGAAGLAETLLALREQIVPPTINLERADPDCDLDYVPHQARPHAFQYALCNCIGFGSKNSALVVAQAE